MKVDLERIKSQAETLQEIERLADALPDSPGTRWSVTRDGLTVVIEGGIRTLLPVE